MLCVVLGIVNIIVYMFFCIGFIKKLIVKYNSMLDDGKC